MSLQYIRDPTFGEELHQVCTISIQELQGMRVEWLHGLTHVNKPHLVFMPKHVVLAQIRVD